MANSVPIYGMKSTHTWDELSATIPNMGQTLVKSLGEVLLRLMAEHDELGTFEKIEKATDRKGVKVGKSTVNRVTTGETVLRIDNLESIAAAFNMKPWMLLRLCDSAEDPLSDHTRPDNLSPAAQQLVALISQADTSQSVSSDSWKQLAGIVKTMMGRKGLPADNARPFRRPK